MLTLVAPPGARLDPSLIEAGKTALALGGAKDIQPPALFAEGRAVDLAWEGDPWSETVAATVRTTLLEKPVDFAVQPARIRQKRLLVADMDSTMVTSETLDEMAAIAGIGEHVAAITARAMNGELDFAAALKERVGLLEGMDAAVFEQTYAAIELSPGAADLVRTMRASGAECRLVSGGFKYFTRRVAARLGFHEEQANDIEVVDGKITGQVLEPILDGSAKVTALERALAELNLGLDAAVTVGDGSNDIPMLQAAGLGVAWRGKPAVKAAVRARVDHGDLTTLLLFQRMDPV